MIVRPHPQPAVDPEVRAADPSASAAMRVRRIVQRLAGLSVLIVVWQLVTSAFRVPAYILPQPLVLVTGLVADRAQIIDGLRPLALEASLGFLLGNGLGVVLAVVVNSVGWAKSVVHPIALAVRSVPIVAITPLISLILGFGMQTTVAVATLITFFPMFVNMSRGLVAVEPQAVEMFRVLDATWFTTYWKLRWPSAAPYLYASLRVTAPGAVLGAMVAEYIASNAGLGYMLQESANAFRYGLMWEIVVVVTALVVAIFLVVSWMERRLAPWAAPR